MMSDMWERLAAWVVRDVGWWEFGRTRGAFTFGGVLIDLRPQPERRDVLKASGGFLPGRLEWSPWERFYLMPRIVDLLPAFSAPRGGIRFIGPPRLLP